MRLLVGGLRLVKRLLVCVARRQLMSVAKLHQNLACELLVRCRQRYNT